MEFFRWCYKHRLILIINFICFILYVVFSLIFSGIVKKTYDQQEGMRFAAGDEPYHQVSAFWPADEKKTKSDISAVRASLSRSITEASIEQEEVNGKLWTDAFCGSATGDLTRLSEVGQTGKEGVVIMGVGGDFFLFHPLELISGSPFSQDQINTDLVYIDNKSAWALYGSTDIAGQRLYVDQKPFVISGVYKAPDDKLSLKASEGKSVLFMSYEAFSQMYPEAPVTAYEAVLPNPVSTFAINSLQNATGGEGSTAVIQDNEARFSMKSLLARFSDMSSLLMDKSAVVFPFWENRTRALEWRLFLLLICRIFAFTVILVSAIFALVSWMRNKGTGLWKMFKAKLRDKISRMLWERPVKKKVKIEDEEF